MPKKWRIKNAMDNNLNKCIGPIADGKKQLTMIQDKSITIFKNGTGIIIFSLKNKNIYNQSFKSEFLMNIQHISERKSCGKLVTCKCE